MKAYFDTSAFAMLSFADKGYEALDRWIGTFATETCFSDFGWGEFVSSVGRRVRERNREDEIGHRLLTETRIYLRTWSDPIVISEDIDDASKLLADFSLNLSLPDAIHVAIARRIGAVLITTDRHQLRAARHVGCAAINPLFGETKS